MAIIANRVKVKNHLFELSKFAISIVKKLLAIALILFACYLLYFPAAKLMPNLVMEITGRTLSATHIIYQGSLQKINWFYDRVVYFRDLESENTRLKLELAELKSLHQLDSSIRLENENLRKLLNVAKSPKIEFVTARILGVSLTPFSSSAMVEAGSNSGVELDDIVITNDGLLGRVGSVGTNYATVMLLSDHNSRVPVLTGLSKERGILARQDEFLKIIYLNENHKVKEGEVVYTSGDGKIYPHGIKVGEVEKVTNEGVLVKPAISLKDVEFAIIQKKQQY